ncbi:hypothetical protein B0T14DRAFT_188095 [Immersiella caudata]|uniref:Secreted protein n=1 Tax=Immersiella caudata TaxID=314043 RepID=A0AA40C3T3_9PEZI|nr:hypothetical protein B0T14DRAFT_188095 [Immersiella caudata]
MLMFLGSAARFSLLCSLVCRTRSREGGVHGVHETGGLGHMCRCPRGRTGKVQCLGATGRYEKVQGNEVLTEGHWDWGGWWSWSTCNPSRVRRESSTAAWSRGAPNCRQQAFLSSASRDAMIDRWRCEGDRAGRMKLDCCCCSRRRC